MEGGLHGELLPRYFSSRLQVTPLWRLCRCSLRITRYLFVIFLEGRGGPWDSSLLFDATSLPRYADGKTRLVAEHRQRVQRTPAVPILVRGCNCIGVPLRYAQLYIRIIFQPRHYSRIKIKKRKEEGRISVTHSLHNKFLASLHCNVETFGNTALSVLGTKTILTFDLHRTPPPLATLDFKPACGSHLQMSGKIVAQKRG